MMERSANRISATLMPSRNRRDWYRINATLLLFLAFVFTATQAYAQVSSSATIVAEIASPPLSLQNTGGLHFGRILPYGRRGNVTVHANGHSVASNAYMLDASAVRAASWTVSGTPGAPYRVVLPTSLTVQNGSASMTLSWIFRSGPSSLALDGNGSGAFTVGAVLDVGANQAPGTYLGLLPVTVGYE